MFDNYYKINYSIKAIGEDKYLGDAVLDKTINSDTSEGALKCAFSYMVREINENSDVYMAEIEDDHILIIYRKTGEHTRMLCDFKVIQM